MTLIPEGGCGPILQIVQEFALMAHTAERGWLDHPTYCEMLVQKDIIVQLGSSTLLLAQQELTMEIQALLHYSDALAHPLDITVSRPPLNPMAYAIPGFIALLNQVVQLKFHVRLELIDLKLGPDLLKTVQCALLEDIVQKVPLFRKFVRKAAFAFGGYISLSLVPQVLLVTVQG